VTDTLQARLRARLDASPESRALAFPGEDGRFVWRSLAECAERAARCAAAFAERGLGPGDVCVLVLPSDELCASCLLGAVRVGAVPLLVAPPLIRGMHSNRREVIEHVVAKTSAKVVVGGDDVRDARGRLERAFPSTRFLFGPGPEVEGDPAAAPHARPAADDFALFQLTSGTTGFPRICMWRHDRVLAALDGMERSMALAADDVCVNWTPLYHDMGLMNNFFLCLVKGVPLALFGALDFVKRPALWLRALSDVGATQTWSPNFGYAITAQRAKDAELAGVRLDGMRAFWNAAERIHYETMVAFGERFAPLGVTRGMLKTNFGCAENVGGATFSAPSFEAEPVVEHVVERELYETGEARRSAPGAAGTVAIVSCGRPVPGMRIRIAGEDGRDLPEGRVGEVVLDTPSQMSGYLGDEEATREALRGDGLRTGDLGYVRDGELFWVGRARERINLHGQKLDPSDFERVLFGIEGVRDGSFAAFGVDDARLGTQRLVLVVETRRGGERAPEEILGDVRERILRQMGVPVGEILLVDEGTITKTSSGKRRHRFYRELYLAGRLEASARG